MLEMKGYEFVTAVRLLTALETLIDEDEEIAAVIDRKVGKNTWASTRQAYKQFDDACAALGADITRMVVAEVFAGPQPTFRQLSNQTSEVRRTFDRELTRARLFALNNDDAKYYDGAVGMFGSQVTGAFPSTAAEIDEAGKCLALGRAPATVYHLMRTVEIALRSLAIPLAITAAKPSWHTVIQKLSSEIKKEPKDRTLKADYAFLESVAAEMHAVNRAWRRNAMHVDATFSLDNAHDIFNATKALMQHLAGGGLREPTAGSTPS